MLGEPICVRTLSSHCKGPLRCSSIQQGVLVTVWRLQGTEMHRSLLFLVNILIYGIILVTSVNNAVFILIQVTSKTNSTCYF